MIDQRNDSTIFSNQPQTTNLSSALNGGGVVDHDMGVGQGVVDKVAHPIYTLKDAAVAVYDLITDPEGTAKLAQSQARNVAQQADDGNFKPAGELVWQPGMRSIKEK